MAPHQQYQISGRMHVVMSDGTELDAGPGEITSLPPGHDSELPETGEIAARLAELCDDPPTFGTTRQRSGTSKLSATASSSADPKQFRTCAATSCPGGIRMGRASRGLRSGCWPTGMPASGGERTGEVV
jgi:hypothetical protein